MDNDRYKNHQTKSSNFSKTKVLRKDKLNNTNVNELLEQNKVIFPKLNPSMRWRRYMNPPTSPPTITS